MDDLFKKFINTGVGFLSQGNKRIQNAIDKLVQESKISEQEGKKIMDDLRKSSDTKRADLEKQFKKLTGDLRGRVGLVAEQEQPTSKPAAKAPATKKPASKPAAKAAGSTAKKTPSKPSSKAAPAPDQPAS